MRAGWTPGVCALTGLPTLPSPVRGRPRAGRASFLDPGLAGLERQAKPEQDPGVLSFRNSPGMCSEAAAATGNNRYIHSPAGARLGVGGWGGGKEEALPLVKE